MLTGMLNLSLFLIWLCDYERIATCVGQHIAENLRKFSSVLYRYENLHVTQVRTDWALGIAEILLSIIE